MSARTPQQAYLDLQNLARAQGRNTQQLFELYIHERFLARLAESRFSEMLVEAMHAAEIKLLESWSDIVRSWESTR